MDFYRQRIGPITPEINPGTPVNTGFFLLLLYMLMCDAHAGQSDTHSAQPPAHVYTIQMESSRKPYLSDYDKVRQYGPVYTKKDNTGRNLTYVRMGYYNSHAAAKQMLKKIRAEGFHDAYIIRTRQTVQSIAQERTTSPPLRPADRKIKIADEATEKTDTASAHLYAIHVESTDNPDMKSYDAIRQYGAVYMSYQYSQQAAEKKTGKDLIRIMIGYFETQAEVEKVLGKIKAVGFSHARIIRVPDRSRVSQNIPSNFRNFTRFQPKPASGTNNPPDSNQGTAKQDPFTPLEKPGADPFE